MELGCCLYHPNRVGSGVGPRRMEVCLPNASTMPQEGKSPQRQRSHSIISRSILLSIFIVKNTPETKLACAWGVDSIVHTALKCDWKVRQ